MSWKCTLCNYTENNAAICEMCDSPKPSGSVQRQQSTEYFQPPPRPIVDNNISLNNVSNFIYISDHTTNY